MSELLFQISSIEPEGYGFHHIDVVEDPREKPTVAAPQAATSAASPPVEEYQLPESVFGEHVLHRMRDVLRRAGTIFHRQPVQPELIPQPGESGIRFDVGNQDRPFSFTMAPDGRSVELLDPRSDQEHTLRQQCLANDTLRLTVVEFPVYEQIMAAGAGSMEELYFYLFKCGVDIGGRGLLTGAASRIEAPNGTPLVMVMKDVVDPLKPGDKRQEAVDVLRIVHDGQGARHVITDRVVSMNAGTGDKKNLGLLTRDVRGARIMGVNEAMPIPGVNVVVPENFMNIAVPPMGVAIVCKNGIYYYMLDRGVPEQIPVSEREARVNGIAYREKIQDRLSGVTMDNNIYLFEDNNRYMAIPVPQTPQAIRLQARAGTYSARDLLEVRVTINGTNPVLECLGTTDPGKWSARMDYRSYRAGLEIAARDELRRAAVEARQTQHAQKIASTAEVPLNPIVASVGRTHEFDV